MEEVLLMPEEMAEGEGKPLVSTSTSSSCSSSSPTQLPSPSTPGSTPVHSPSALKNRQVEPLYPEADENKQSQMRLSSGSVGRTMPPTNESLDMRRQSFTAMAADSRASMRRLSYDLSTTPHHTTSSPEGGSPVGLAGVSAALQTMGMAAIAVGSLPDNTGHLQHLRVYWRTNPTAGAPVTASPTLPPSTGGANVATTRLSATTVRENHVEGEALVDVVSPATDTVWTRGRPVTIEWKVLDAAVPALAIELLEEGSAATTVIAREAPNTGSFTYHRVPWGMASGSKYFLKVSAATLAATRTTSVSMATATTVAAMVSSSARYMTTGFFSISSAP